MLTLRQWLDVDVVHLYDTASHSIIVSTGRRFEATVDGAVHRFTLPLSPWLAWGLCCRLWRRSLRLDGSNAVLNARRDGIVLLYQGCMHFYDLERRSLRRTGALRQCGNVLHRGIAVTPRGIYLGEYGRNPQRRPVPIYRSSDDGRSWDVAYEFPAGSIRHVHGVYADPYSDRLWIPTGDRAGECWLVSADYDFTDVVRHGDGSQAWRAVTLFFEPDRIVWAMDSEGETPHLQVFDRSTGALARGRAFPGPVWYGKRLADGRALLQTTVEIGAGVRRAQACVFTSSDLDHWREVACFDKDRWPMRWCRFGVVGFADGHQTAEDFVLFGEALQGVRRPRLPGEAGAVTSRGPSIAPPPRRLEAQPAGQRTAILAAVLAAPDQRPAGRHARANLDDPSPERRLLDAVCADLTPARRDR